MRLLLNEYALKNPTSDSMYILGRSMIGCIILRPDASATSEPRAPCHADYLY